MQHNKLIQQYSHVIYRTYTILNIICFNNKHLSQVVGPLMEHKPKLLVHRNVVPYPIVMLERDNPIPFLCRNMVIRSQVVMPKHRNWIHQHTTITNTSTVPIIQSRNDSWHKLFIYIIYNICGSIM